MLMALLAMAVVFTSSPPNAPRLITLDQSAIILPRGNIMLNPFEHDQCAFAGGKLWIVPNPINYLASADWRFYLCDIEQRKVLGLMSNAVPVWLNADQTKVLCVQPTLPKSRFKMRLEKLINQVTFGRIKIKPHSVGVRVYWLLNLKNNAAIRIGVISPDFISAGWFHQSPDLRYAFVASFGANMPAIVLPPGLKRELVYFDFERQTFQELPLVGRPIGWWDNSNIIVKHNDDFVLINRQTGRTVPFLSAMQIGEFFHLNSISNDPSLVQAMSTWNGQANDYYLYDGQQKWIPAESYLVKIERPGAKLKLLSRHFKYECDDSFDPSGRYYLYTKHGPGKQNNGVIVRDLQTGTERTLVTLGTNEYYSMPEFYRDSVLYFRSNILWRINLDGTHNTRLFPP